jgi:hypothetical protein
MKEDHEKTTSPTPESKEKAELRSMLDKIGTVATNLLQQEQEKQSNQSRQQKRKALRAWNKFQRNAKAPYYSSSALGRCLKLEQLLNDFLTRINADYLLSTKAEGDEGLYCTSVFELIRRFLDIRPQETLELILGVENLPKGAVTMFRTFDKFLQQHSKTAEDVFIVKNDTMLSDREYQALWAELFRRDAFESVALMPHPLDVRFMQNSFLFASGRFCLVFWVFFWLVFFFSEMEGKVFGVLFFFLVF